MILELTKLEYHKKWQITIFFRNSVSGQNISRIDGIWPLWPKNQLQLTFKPMTSFPQPKKNKSITLKTVMEEENDTSDEQWLNDEDLDLFAKKFRKFFKPRKKTKKSKQLLSLLQPPVRVVKKLMRRRLMMRKDFWQPIIIFSRSVRWNKIPKLSLKSLKEIEQEKEVLLVELDEAKRQFGNDKEENASI